MENKGTGKRQEGSRKGHIGRRFIRLCSMTFAILTLFLLFMFSMGEAQPQMKLAQMFSPVVLNSDNNEGVRPPAILVDLKDLNSGFALLVDLDSGIAIAGQNSKEKMYPASLTKIMTAILAVENTDDLSQTVTIPYDFFQELYKQNASVAGFEPGEEVPLKDLLYGILLPSGAECSMTFAERISGSEAAFVDLMNQKAEELGMADTHFCNSTGLHEPDHYSTAADISILLQYALENKDFRETFTSRRYNTSPTNRHSEGFTFYSSLFKKQDSIKVEGGEILGGKTGYTEEAGLCLASLAKIDEREYIFITAKANGSHRTEPLHVLDAVNVYGQIAKYKIR